MRPENRELIVVASTPELMLEKLLSWKAPAPVEKWLDRARR
jgi:hypothetical protein